MTAQVEQTPEVIPDVKNIAPQEPIVQAQTIEKEPESAQEVNWRKYREQRAIERKQKEEAEKRATEKAAEAEALKAAMEALLNKQTPQQSQQYRNTYESSESEISEDEKIEKKVEAALQKRLHHEEQLRLQREQQEYPTRLTQTYQDFNAVCNTENLDYLDFHYPEITAAYKHMPDGFDKWSSVYKAVKRFVPNTDTKKDLLKMEKNMQKPHSPSSIGTATPTGTGAPHIITEEKRAANWARMEKARKGLS